MTLSSRSVLLACATFVCAVVACTSSSTSPSDGTSASGSDDTSKSEGPSEGPTTCSGDCADCEPVACLCDDGTTVRQCACSTGSKLVCADNEFCSTLHGCDDHGGPAAKQPSTSKKDAGTSSDADEVLVTGRLDTAAKTQTSGKYTLLVDEAQSVTYSPDNLGGVTFTSTGFSSSELGEPTITSPAVKSCKPTIEVGLGLGNATLTVSGTDTTNTDCNTFVNAVFSDGIELSFADVKFNGYTITSLKVNLSGH